MEALSELNSTKEDLEGRLRKLEEEKVSLEKEISFLVEQIPILDMERHASLLESQTRALKGVRDMLSTIAHELTSSVGEQTVTVAPSISTR